MIKHSMKAKTHRKLKKFGNEEIVLVKCRACDNDTYAQQVIV